MQISIADVKKLRLKSGAAMMDCKQALTDAEGDYDKALTLVKERGLAKAAKKQDRETSEGYIASYIHSTGKVAALVELRCETDFVARNQEFRDLAHSIAMQVTAMNPADVQELLEQEYIRDAGATIEFLVKQLTSKLGEKVVVARFTRYSVGE